MARTTGSLRTLGVQVSSTIHYEPNLGKKIANHQRWNAGWGENGFMRISRGNNQCHLADYAYRACATQDCRTSSAPVVNPSPAPAPGPSGWQWQNGASAYWFAVTIPGSSSAKVNCNNGQGWVTMQNGWASNMWIFTAAGSPCSKTATFIVNGGAQQSVTLSFV